MILVEVDDPLLQFRAALTLLNGQDEQLDVRVQGELVHGVDTAHVVEDEEQDGGSLGTGAVALERRSRSSCSLKYNCTSGASSI